MARLIRPVTITDAIMTSTNVVDLIAAWDAGTAYTTGQYVSYEVGANVHQVYKAVAGSTGVTPGTDATKWLYVGLTNKWALHDGSVQSQTSNPTSIDITYTFTGYRVDRIGLLNLNASSVRVKVTDSAPGGDGVVYDQTQSLVVVAGIDDYWPYCFEEVTYLKDVQFTDLPPYYSPIIEVVISQPGGTAYCGALVPGLSRDLGATQYGTQLGIHDYSVKSTDQFGNITPVARSYSKTVGMTIWCNATQVDPLTTLLAGYRTTPILYSGSDAYNATLAYGYFKDFSTVIQSVSYSILNLNVESLT